ncbi:MAG: hypothetical protein HYU36_04880 [Planctomycetes bacterium]|nr:hypothetical protein [Planctomycetota bacterium]
MDEEVGRFKKAIYVFLLFCVSLWGSCQEIRFSLKGRTSAGELKKTYDTTGRRMRPMVAATYEFKAEDSRPYTCTIKVDPSAATSLQKTEEVIYLPSDPKTNELVSHRAWIWPLMALILLAIGVAVVAATVKEANEALGTSKKKGKR